MKYEIPADVGVFYQHRMRKQKPKHKILDIQYFVFGVLLSQVLLVEKYQQRQNNG